MKKSIAKTIGILLIIIGIIIVFVFQPKCVGISAKPGEAGGIICDPPAIIYSYPLIISVLQIVGAILLLTGMVVLFVSLKMKK